MAFPGVDVPEDVVGVFISGVDDVLLVNMFKAL